LRRGARSRRACGRLAKWRSSDAAEPEELEEASPTQLELQHLKAIHETLQKEHEGLKKQHQDRPSGAHEEIPEGRLPPVPEGPGVQEPVEGEPPQIPEGADQDPPAAPGEPTAPDAPAAPTAPESPPPPPAPKKLLQPTPSAAAKWGWWRNSRVVPEPDAGAFTRHVVRFKDGVQLGPPRVERVWLGTAEGAQGSGYASSLPKPPAAPPAPPAPSTLPGLPEAIGSAPQAWQLQEVWDRLSKPALVPVSIPGCAHLSPELGVPFG
ncbi:RBMS2, partial [Symbiodinium necroappetens]